MGTVLNRFFKKEDVEFRVIRGDITLYKENNRGNIVRKVSDVVRAVERTYYLKDSDFREVIHIVDMDGAFIPDSKIIYDESREDPYYCEEGIYTQHTGHIKERNKRKQENLNVLCELCYIRKNIPYRVYYMSANLDHVLYDKPNNDSSVKVNDAQNFAKQYKENIDGFIAFMSKSEFSVSMGYKESWNFIKEDMHSLERHSNFCLCFKEN